MKKLSTLTALLLAATLVFMGCKQQADDKSDPYSDCSNSTTTLDFADGDWTLTTTISGKEDGYSYTEEDTYHAVVSGGDYNFTSGTSKITMNTKELMGENYEDYKDLPPAYKEQMKEYFKESVKYMIPSSMGTVEEVSINEVNIVVLVDLSSTMLAQVKTALNPNNLPAGTTIKTNDEKTKYIISTTINGKTYTYYATKD